MLADDVDLLPEEIDWCDEGCDIFPSCLNCPLPRCIEEEPRGKQRLRTSARAKRMVAFRQNGKSVREIAELFGVTERTVQRALRARQGSHEHTSGVSEVKGSHG